MSPSSTVLFGCDTWHSQVIDANMLTTSALLVTGTALFLVAQWRGWRPSVRTALAAGIILRVAVWALAVVNSWQPFDFADDFSAAAIAVLHHQDPMLTGRTGGWHFLPPMSFVFAGELWLCYATNLPWQLVGRVAPVLADLALIPLVGRLSRDRGRLRSFQYACNPLSIMVCAIHAQIEPEMLALGAAAFAVALMRRRAIADRAVADRALADRALADRALADRALADRALADRVAADRATAGRAAGGRLSGILAASGLKRGGRAPGILIGLSIALGTWSALLLPGLLKLLPGRAGRVRAAGWAIFVPAAALLTSPLTVGTPVGKLPTVVSTLMSAQPLVGDWGWTAIATHGQEVMSAGLSRPGMLILVAALLAVGYLWRRADPIDLTVALLLTFLIFSPRFGDQYLMWPLPFLIARKTRFSTLAILVASAWAGIGEVYMGPLSWTAWQQAHVWWAYSSLAVIAALILALAGISRRQTTLELQPLTALPDSAQLLSREREPAAAAASSLAAGSQQVPGWRRNQPGRRRNQPEPAPP